MLVIKLKKGGLKLVEPRSFANHLNIMGKTNVKQRGPADLKAFKKRQLWQEQSKDKKIPKDVLISWCSFKESF